MLLMMHLAFADALWMPDEACPKGSEWNVSHSASFCSPTVCSADCAGSCREVGLCVVDMQMSCNSGRLPDEEPCWFDASVASGTCDDDGDCAEGICVVAERCTKSPLKEGLKKAAKTVEDTTGCGCSSSFAPSWLGALLVLAAGLRRRR